MNNALQELLRKDEKIVWEGTPSKDIKAFEAPYSTKIMIRFVISLILVGFGVYYMAVMGPSLGNDAGMSFSVAAFFFIIGIYTSVSPFLAVKRLTSKTHYYITNQRFITVMGGNNPNITYREFNDITEATIDLRSSDRADLYIVPMTKQIYNHSRDFVRPYREEDKMAPMVFCGIENAFEACDFFPTHIAINRNTSANPVFTN
ncbi:MAG: hypothetical protein ACOX7F_03980 [Eubacteriales bacterium]|jgi:hypothetical protein